MEVVTLTYKKPNCKKTVTLDGYARIRIPLIRRLQPQSMIQVPLVAKPFPHLIA
jgi:hypothetical protein